MFNVHYFLIFAQISLISKKIECAHSFTPIFKKWVRSWSSLSFIKKSALFFHSFFVWEGHKILKKYPHFSYFTLIQIDLCLIMIKKCISFIVSRNKCMLKKGQILKSSRLQKRNAFIDSNWSMLDYDRKTSNIFIIVKSTLKEVWRKHLCYF